MQSSVTESRTSRPTRLNWGLILSVAANAVLVLGIVFLVKAGLTMALMKLFGAE